MTDIREDGITENGFTVLGVEWAYKNSNLVRRNRERVRARNGAIRAIAICDSCNEPHSFTENDQEFNLNNVLGAVVISCRKSGKEAAFKSADLEKLD